ncbi:hypothetical protein LJR153_007219 [Paenibacillus sp. LjRoot153]
MIEVGQVPNYNDQMQQLLMIDLEGLDGGTQQIFVSTFSILNLMFQNPV